ncbi:hypothetical protein pipiens_010235 [Culex pipiens pipiens]|uniref:Uncharacterized protein n=1 Tax=Culex pipiens pipiens TaxID=38569 RepID=A0ABD1DAX5_CULPP
MIARRRRRLKIVCVGSGRILAVCLEREFAWREGRNCGRSWPAAEERVLSKKDQLESEPTLFGWGVWDRARARILREFFGLLRCLSAVAQFSDVEDLKKINKKNRLSETQEKKKGFVAIVSILLLIIQKQAHSSPSAQDRPSEEEKGKGSEQEEDGNSAAVLLKVHHTTTTHTDWLLLKGERKRDRDPLPVA